MVGRMRLGHHRLQILCHFLPFLQRRPALRLRLSRQRYLLVGEPVSRPCCCPGLIAGDRMQCFFGISTLAGVSPDVENVSYSYSSEHGAFLGCPLRIIHQEDPRLTEMVLGLLARHAN